MRRYDVRSVQAIAILGLCFNIFGDYNLYQTMWACAVQIARHLGMDTEGSNRDPAFDQERSRRLWWTLVICDW